MGAADDGQVVQDYELGLPCPRCHEPTLVKVYVSHATDLGPALIATLQGCTTCRNGIYTGTPPPQPCRDEWPSKRYLVVLVALALIITGLLVLTH